MYSNFINWIHNTPSLFAANTKHSVIASQFPPLNGALPHIHQAYTHNSRLGFLYQHLCQALFIQHSNYTVLAEEIQLNDHQRTLGAIDFILHNTHHDKIEHWEVAIKFYLLLDNHWYGPNAQDRLDKKLAHMLNHQLAMSRCDYFCQAYPQWSQCKPKLLLQGRLYINPFLTQPIPTHCLDQRINRSRIEGYWCYAAQAHLIDQPLYRLDKNEWAVTNTKNKQSIDLNEIKRFVHAISADNRYWFIVNNEWPHDL